MNKLTKRLLAAVLLTIMLALMPVSCKTNLSGSDTAKTFLSCIANRKFKKAYGYVNTEMSSDEFTAMYESFFDTLAVQSCDFSMKSTFDHEVYSEFSYTFTYHSDLCGDMTDDYTMIIRPDKSGFRHVSWSPALIYPDMAEGDSILSVRVSAKRGEIIADHVSLAQDVPQKTVSINTILSDEHTKNDIDRAVTEVAVALGLEAEYVESRICYHVYFNTVTGDKSLDSAKAQNADKKKAAEILGISKGDTEAAISAADKGLTNSDGTPQNVKAEIATIRGYDMTEDMLSALKGLSHISVKSNIYNGVALIAEYPAARADEDALSQLEQTDKSLGIIVSESSVSTSRYYPEKDTLAHILGYTGAMAAEDADERVAQLNEGRTEEDGLYTKNSVVGTTGIERAYESVLRGKDGSRIILRSKEGRTKKVFFEKPAENGLDVQLTIDYELQKKAEALLENVIYGDVKGGAVIVMNPDTGKIEALCSYPDYDLNLFATGITKEEYEELSALDAPFTNRAIQGRFIPGSVIKAVTAAAALTNHVVDENYVFDGTIINDTWKIPEKYGSTAETDRIKRDKVKRRNEPLNMRNAFIHSDNIYFASIMLKMGDERFENYWNSLGLNEPIDFELNVARSQYKQKDAERNIITIAETGFGQGTMLVTPLQLACTYCAFANRGSIPVPYIVDGLYKEDGNDYVAVEKTSPRMWRENVVKGHICDTITEMLEAVTNPKNNGTAQALRVQSYTIAGKTGTAQTTKGRNNSWFIGYRSGVSAKDARLCLVLLEVPAEKEYSALKLKIARELLEKDN